MLTYFWWFTLASFPRLRSRLQNSTYICLAAVILPAVLPSGRSFLRLYLDDWKGLKGRSGEWTDRAKMDSVEGKEARRSENNGRT